MKEVIVLLMVTILLFIAGFLVAIYLSYRKIKDLEKKNAIINNELKNIIAETDFIHCFRELVGIINSQNSLNNVISNISKIIYNALDLEEGEAVIFFSFNKERNVFEFLYSYPEMIKNIPIKNEFSKSTTTKTKILHNEDLFLLYPIYFDTELNNFLVLSLKSQIKNFDIKLKNIEYKIEELIRFISLGFKTPVYYERAIKDLFTGLYNKIHFENHLKTFSDLSRRENIPLSLIILDIDDFKKINDVYGHHVGDKVIKEISRILKSSIRNYNLPYRIGGEEFAIILPNCKKDRAYIIAERIRKKVEKSNIVSDSISISNVTISLGVNELKNNIDSQEFLKITDMALYAAKKNGKNRTIIYEANN